MGVHDSSQTRVKPVLDCLFDSDATGSWLLPLLRLSSMSHQLPPDFDPGLLTRPPQYEFPASPTHSFLHFLLSNPSGLSKPPEKVWEKWSFATQAKRRALLAGDTSAQQEGLQLLGVAKKFSGQSWWRLEGVTKVDCALFTDNTVVFIEGKRTEIGPSRDVTWWTGRNQVIRNLECALSLAEATGRKYALGLLIVEEGLCGAGTDRARHIDSIIDPKVVQDSLPHLDAEARNRIMACYVGTTSWQAIVRRFSLNPSVLIDAV
jgi:hypothetical protein